MDRIITAISADGMVRCQVIDSTAIVNRVEQIHKTSATATAALGRLVTAASLMGSHLKGKDESLTLRIKGEGPIGSIIAVSDYEGNVRGYVENPIVEIPLSPAGKLDVSGAIGANGQLSVIRDFGFGDPYVGTTELYSGEIAEDITAYYAYSEQTPTSCGLGVLVNKDLSVIHAGGFLLQLMPDATDENITQLEKNLGNIKPVTTMMSEGKTLEDILGILMDNMEPKIIEEHNIEYRCNCSRERVEKALISIGRKDLEELKEEDEVTQVDCHFCNEKYNFTRDEISKLIEQLD